MFDLAQENMQNHYPEHKVIYFYGREIKIFAQDSDLKKKNCRIKFSDKKLPLKQPKHII